MTLFCFYFFLRLVRLTPPAATLQVLKISKVTFTGQLIKGKGRVKKEEKKKKKRRPCHVSTLYILYIVNLILNNYKLLYMGCEFCYFYFLNLIHEN